MPISEEQERFLSKYRKKALERLRKREYRRRANDDDILAIYLIARSYDVPAHMIQQMTHDLKTYLLYDSLAMWLDAKAGLASYAPEAMIAIGRYYLEDDRSV